MTRRRASDTRAVAESGPETARARSAETERLMERFRREFEALAEKAERDFEVLRERHAGHRAPPGAELPEPMRAAVQRMIAAELVGPHLRALIDERVNARLQLILEQLQARRRNPVSPLQTLRRTASRKGV
jgi:hypothetical protein